MTTDKSHNAKLVQRSLAGGPINAEVKNGILRARGIRYAVAPRFQPPTQPQPWTKPIDCTKPGPVCPQLPSRLSVVIGDVLVNRTQDEDCLFLSVTAPASPSTKLPVMVWFHGGAFMSGGGDLDPYEPTGLAERGVVVINVNYRLGIFGQLGILGTSPANLGLLDQIMALRWVHDNIHNFGGDPERVTIFGQSAGADSCYYMLLAEGVDGLFHRAILQSTPFGSHKDIKHTARTLGKQASEALHGRAQSATSKELLELQADLARAGTNLPNGLLAFSPQLDIYPLPNESEVEARLQRQATNIPILIGWTAQDALPFIPPELDPRPSVDSATLTQFKAGSLDLHNLWSQSGNSSTYEFEYYPDNNPLQASHCIDLAFTLGSWEYWSTTPVLQGISRATFDRLANNVKDTWVSFANGAKFSSHLRITDDFQAPPGK